MNFESHSESNSASVGSLPNSLQDEYKTMPIMSRPLSSCHTVDGINEHQIMRVAHRKAQSCTSDINATLSNFIELRKNIESRNDVWFSNDERESRQSLYSEESKESVNWQQEYQKLERQLRGMEHARDIQVEEHENTEQKLKQSIIVLDTEKHNLQQELENSWSFVRDLQSKLRIMQEEMHDLAVDNSVLRSNMSEPWIDSGWNVEEYDSVSKEDVLKILEEHNKELQENNSQINSLSSECRKLVSDKLQLEEDIEKLNTELKIRVEELIKKKHMIRQANIKWEESYNENTKLEEQIATDDLEINTLKTRCSWLSSRVEELERNANRTLTRRNLRRLDDNLLDWVERVNTAESSSRDSNTSILLPILNSDGSAQDDDSIKSLCGKSLNERSWEENTEEGGSQNTEHERTQPLVFFSRRPSYEKKEEEQSSLTHSDPILQHSSSAVMRSGSNNREGLLSDLSSRDQVGLFLQRRKDSAKRSLIKFSSSKNQTPSERITAGSKSFGEWRWIMSSSFVILATLLYLLKVKLSNTHRQSNQIRRKKRNRIR